VELTLYEKAGRERQLFIRESVRKEIRELLLGLVIDVPDRPNHRFLSGRLVDVVLIVKDSAWRAVTHRRWGAIFGRSCDIDIDVFLKAPNLIDEHEITSYEELYLRLEHLESKEPKSVGNYLYGDGSTDFRGLLRGRWQICEVSDLPLRQKNKKSA
jgi:hypothetical protein